MGRSLDTLHDKMMFLRGTPSLVINEDFIMGILNEHKDEIHPFKEHVNCVFNDKMQQKEIRDRKKHQPFKSLREELFHPKDPSNIEIDFLMSCMGSMMSNTLIEELTDKRKEMKNHTSFLGGELSWGEDSEEENEAGLGLHANNNVSESAFGGLTEAISKSSMISLTCSGAASHSRCNKDFTR